MMASSFFTIADSSRAADILRYVTNARGCQRHSSSRTLLVGLRLLEFTQVSPITESQLHQVPREPYPELRTVLCKLVDGVKGALKGNFLGAYLVGSLATGDFDLDSDIDFLIVINNELSDTELWLLQAVHCEIHGLDCYPARHLEGSYITRAVLNRAELVGIQPLWFIDNGSVRLERSVHDNRWHVRWILRERAITLTGPDPSRLIPPVSRESLLRETRASIAKLKTLFAGEVDKPLAWFNSRFGQSFAVLTCCRMLCTLESGTVQSKFAAVQWAAGSLPDWLPLIRNAWVERTEVRFGLKVRQLADLQLLQETARFIAYAENEMSRQR
jgi:predicted nucleotidyltransferase